MTLPQMFGIVVEYESDPFQTFLVVNDPDTGWAMRPVISGGEACYWLWSMNVDPDTNEIWVIDGNRTPAGIFKSTDLGLTWSIGDTGPPLYLGDMFAQNGMMESTEFGIPFTLYRSGDGIFWASIGNSTHSLEWGWHSDSISAPDGAGRVHWAYEGPHPGHNLYYARSIDNGLNIETPIDLGIGLWHSVGIGVKDEWVYIIHTTNLTSPARTSVYCSYSDNYGAAGSWTIADLVYTSADNGSAGANGYNYFVSIDGTSVYFVVYENTSVPPSIERVKIYEATLGGSWSLIHTETLPNADWGVSGVVAPPTWVGPSDPPMAYAVWSDEYSPDVHLYCNDAEILVFDNNDHPFWLYPVLVGPFSESTPPPPPVPQGVIPGCVIANDIWVGTMHLSPLDFNMDGIGIPTVNPHTVEVPTLQAIRRTGYDIAPRALEATWKHRGCPESRWQQRLNALDEFKVGAREVELYVSLSSGERLYLQNVIASARFDLHSSDPRWEAITLRLTAYDPIWIEDCDRTVTLLLTGATMKDTLQFPVRFSDPAEFSFGSTVISGQSSASIPAITYGTWIVYPVITIYGKLTNLQILNATTGEDITFVDYTIPAGRVVTVVTDPNNRSITDNLGNNLLKYLEDNGDIGGLHLDPDPLAVGGSNSLSINTDGWDDTGYIVLTWRDRYWML